MALSKIAIKNLKLAKFNPASRQSDIGALAQSIERVGLLYPILVAEGNHVVDGHRRISACKKLGWTDVPCLTAKGAQAEMFQEVNTSSRALSGNQTLQVYIVEPLAVSPRMRQRVAELEEMAGRRFVERMAKEGFTIGTWYTAKKIIKLADLDEDDFVVKALRWLMKYRCARVAERALNQGTPPSKVVAAIKNDKPIRVSYVS